jgi:hypothetical protein
MPKRVSFNRYLRVKGESCYFQIYSVDYLTLLTIREKYFSEHSLEKNVFEKLSAGSGHRRSVGELVMHQNSPLFFEFLSLNFTLLH